jgi:hypothetical protein
MEVATAITLRNNPIDVSMNVLEYVKNNPSLTREQISQYFSHYDITSPQYISALVAIGQWPNDVQTYCKDRGIRFSRLRTIAAEKDMDVIRETLGMHNQKVIQHPTMQKIHDIESAVEGFQKDLKALDTEQDSMHQKIDSILCSMNSFSDELLAFRKLAANTLEIPTLRQEQSEVNARMAEQLDELRTLVSTLSEKISTVPPAQYQPVPDSVSVSSVNVSDTKLSKPHAWDDISTWFENNILSGNFVLPLCVLASVAALCWNNTRIFGTDIWGITRATLIDLAIFGFTVRLTAARNKVEAGAILGGIAALVVSGYLVLQSGSEKLLQEKVSAAIESSNDPTVVETRNILNTVKLEIASAQARRDKALSDGRVGEAKRISTEIGEQQKVQMQTLQAFIQANESSPTMKAAKAMADTERLMNYILLGIVIVGSPFIHRRRKSPA